MSWTDKSVIDRLLDVTTTKKLLLEHLYQGDLDRDVEAAFDAGKGWRAIAADVSDRAGINVSYESLRSWYPTLKRERVA